MQISIQSRLVCVGGLERCRMSEAKVFNWKSIKWNFNFKKFTPAASEESQMKIHGNRRWPNFYLPEDILQCLHSWSQSWYLFHKIYFEGCGETLNKLIPRHLSDHWLLSFSNPFESCLFTQASPFFRLISLSCSVNILQIVLTLLQSLRDWTNFYFLGFSQNFFMLPTTALCDLISLVSRDGRKRTENRTERVST